MRLTVLPEQISGEAGLGLEVCIPGFPAGDDGVQFYIEFYNGALQLHVWDGTKEDAVMHYESARRE